MSIVRTIQRGTALWRQVCRCDMDIFVGTSGWSYGWNEGGSLDWFIRNSCLNAVELNMSFYRFPFRNQIAAWAKKGGSLRWSIKVHRFVTHQYKFNDAARGIWNKFLDLFLPLDPFIDYYLFQAPPSMNDAERISDFFDGLNGAEKCALEIRNREMLANDTLCSRLAKNVLLVSVDSPDLQNRIFCSDVIYLRMHGREDWYRHDYSRQELEEIINKIAGIKPRCAYIFFNNDHTMLNNARLMRDLCAQKLIP